ncbi:MAG: aconitase family protein, partial [Phycisphaerales bacterium JB063]
EKTLAYVRNRSTRPEWTVYEEDDDAEYDYRNQWDLADFVPLVAAPHSPDNTKTAYELQQQNVKLDRAYIGSCTGGKITDMLFAANILHKNEVKIPTFVVPGSTEVHADMLRLNLYGEPIDGGTGVSPVDVADSKATTSIYHALEAAGCQIGPASCAACLGGPQDTFGRLNEPINCISTTNRNFPGRMGHKDAGVFLASPLTAAASALRGTVTDPREYVAEPILTGEAGLV